MSGRPRLLVGCSFGEWASTSVGDRSPIRGSAPSFNSALLVLVVGVAGGLMLPALANLPDLTGEVQMLRGALAGCVVGLLGGRLPGPSWASAIGATAALVACALAILLTEQVPSWRGFLAAVVAGAAVALALRALVVHGRHVLAQALALTCVVLTASWFAGAVPDRSGAFPLAARLQQLPGTLRPEGYAWDGLIYLRTNELMNHGMGYYSAFSTAVVQDSRLDENSLSSYLNYRPPFVFLLWRLLPGEGAASILLWFVVFSLVGLLAAYLLASTLVQPGAALLAPIGLIPFFTYFVWADPPWFTMMDLWAGIFALMAVSALVRRWRVTSLLLLVVAALSREFMLLLIPAWLTAWIGWGGRRRGDWWFPVFSVLAPVAALGLHFLAVPPLAGSGGFRVGDWLHGGEESFKRAVQFGWDLLPGLGRPPLWLPVAAVLAALLALPAWRKTVLSLCVVIPIVFLLVVSKSEYDYYWGAFFSPIMMALVPGVFAPWLAVLHRQSFD